MGRGRHIPIFFCSRGYLSYRPPGKAPDNGLTHPGKPRQGHRQGRQPRPSHRGCVLSERGKGSSTSFCNAHGSGRVACGLCARLGRHSGFHSLGWFFRPRFWEVSSQENMVEPVLYRWLEIHHRQVILILWGRAKLEDPTASVGHRVDPASW